MLQAGPDPLVWGGHLLVQGDVLPQVQHSDPPQTERWAQSTGKFWQPSSDNVFSAALTGLPYLTSSDMVLCEVTLLGTDYKHILYQQLNTSHAGKPGNSRKTLKYLKRYFLIQFDPKIQTSYMFLSLNLTFWNLSEESYIFFLCFRLCTRSGIRNFTGQMERSNDFLNFSYNFNFDFSYWEWSLNSPWNGHFVYHC